jgi:calcium-dependent protein kinase
LPAPQLARPPPSTARRLKIQREVVRPRTYQVSDGSCKSLNDLYNVDFENDIIEEGSKSVIYNCIFKETGEERAAKIVEKFSWNGDANASIRSEIELLRKMDHPNIVRVFSTFEDDRYYYIVMDYSKGGELRDQIVRETGMSEFYVAVLVKTVLSTINYCFQKHGVIHLGLKPENILLEGPRSVEQKKLIDFGNSKHAPPTGIPPITPTVTRRIVGR